MPNIIGIGISIFADYINEFHGSIPSIRSSIVFIDYKYRGHWSGRLCREGMLLIDAPEPEYNGIRPGDGIIDFLNEHQLLTVWAIAHHRLIVPSIV